MRRFCVVLGCLLVGLIAARPAHSGYTVKRLATGFHLPVYATTAPGDDDRIFVVQLGGLASHDTDGDPNTSSMGRIRIYDRTTRTVQEEFFLEIPDTDLSEVVPAEPEVGLWALAFHPDYQNNGKFYVNVAVENDNPSSALAITLREYTVSANPNIANPNPTRTLMSLDKPDNVEANHNGTWIGFNPVLNAPNDNKQYLYITLGDGGGQHDPGDDAQRLDSLFGKTLRVDVDAADYYPADPNRDYGVPASNPFVGVAGEDEIWNYGLRNPWQAHFDRQTGDFWIGDVGQASVEEIDFQPASSTGGENYQWRLREGSIATPTGGIGGAAPPGSVGPIYDYSHFGGFSDDGFEGNSVAGGVVYRGPVTELQGKYIFGDSRSGEVWAFDPADPYGSVERMKLLPEFTPDQGIIDYVVSFGEDNQGNLLIVDYDGEIYQVFPTSDLTLTVDRTSGEITWNNPTGSAVGLSSYNLTSARGAIDPDQIIPITGNYDITPPSGNGSVDANDTWQITSPGGSHTIFSEESTGDAGAIPVAPPLEFGDGGTWIKSIYEDLQLEIILPDGTPAFANVVFVGNDDQPFDRSDLNFNGDLDSGDWDIFLANHDNVMAGMSAAQSYQFGDLDGDGDNDFGDFRLFQADYIAVNGEGAFAALLNGVPEPSSLVLMLTLAAAGACFRPKRRGRSSRSLAAVAVVGISLFACSASADLVHQYTFNDGNAVDPIGNAHGTLLGGVTIDSFGVAHFPGGNGDYINLPAGIINITGFTDASFETWFTFDGGSVWQRVFDFGRTVTAGGAIGQGRDYIFYSPSSGGGDNRAAITDDGGGDDEDVATAGPPVSIGTQHHVVVTVDDSSNGGTGRMTVYLDGSFGGDVELTNSLSDVSNIFAYLGRSVWNDPYLNGSIDEFRIYDHPLSLQEVEQNHDDGPVPLELLEMEVNTFTGAISVKNNHTSPVAFDYYRVTSVEGTLNPDGWMSLDQQNIDATGGGTGQSWDEAGSPDANGVAELYLRGATTLDPGESRDLGQLFDPTVFGKREEGDLVFEYATQGGGLRPGDVTYIIPPPLPGDYNDNGVVDAADYTVWRDHLGSNFQLPNEVDGVSPGMVTSADYTEWKLRFGDTLSGSGSLAQGIATPEPASAVMLLLAFAWPVRWIRSTRRR